MRPGQLKPNEFEVAILERLALDLPRLVPLISQLHVQSREYTGVGSYTNFLCAESTLELGEQPVHLNSLISMPGVPNGMGAVLFFENGKPKFLEIFTYGDPWDGVYDGFSIDKVA